MQDEEEVRRRLEAHGDRLRDHEAAIAVLTERASAGEKDRLALWGKKEAHDDQFIELRKDLDKQHKELMAAITANRQATSIITGERGAGKWILGFVATVVLVVVGVIALIVEAIQWLGAR